jgi:hypothetical protein
MTGGHCQIEDRVLGPRLAVRHRASQAPAGHNQVCGDSMSRTVLDVF